MKARTKKPAGFTLLELLIAVSLLAITAGISSDIILTLVRTYTRTRATNEIQQQGVLVMAKIEKELKSAVSITSPSTSTDACLNSVSFTKSDGTAVTYTLSGAVLTRTDNTQDPAQVVEVISGNSGIRVVNGGSPMFCLVQTSPAVVHVHLVLEDGPTATQSLANVTLDQTVVIRGTY